MSSSDMSVYMRERRRDRRNRLIEILGGSCSEYGEVDGLEFHHTDPSAKTFTLTGKALDGNWETILLEAKKCKLLCGRCHELETARIRMPPHGTIARYIHRKNPCRCDLCRSAYLEKNSEYKARYRAKKIAM